MVSTIRAPRTAGFSWGSKARSPSWSCTPFATAHRRAPGQGQTRRAGPRLAEWPAARPQRRRHEGSPPRGSGADHLVFDSPAAAHRREGDAHAAACGLMLPRRDCFGEICWKRPTIPAVTDILKNPAYAAPSPMVEPPYAPRGRRVGGPCKAPQPASSWRIVVKDRYPATSASRSSRKSRPCKQDNRAEYVRLKSRGVPRDGAALLHGITWCGECGHKMVVRYKGAASMCNHLHQQHDAPVCQCLRAAPIDTAVAAAFLEAVAPAEVEAWSRHPQGSDPSRRCSASRRGAASRAPSQGGGAGRASVQPCGSRQPAGRSRAGAALGGCAGCARLSEEPREAAGHRHPEQ